MNDPDIEYLKYLKLLRAWVLLELTRMTPEAKEQLLWGNLTFGHVDVDDCVKSYINHDLGTCKGCNCRAPMFNDDVCAWGCI